MANELILLVRVIVGFLVGGAGLQRILGWFPDQVESRRTGNALVREAYRPVIGGVQVLCAALVILGIWPFGSILLVAMSLVALMSHDWNRALWGRLGRSIPITLMLVAGLILISGPGRYSVHNVDDLLPARDAGSSAATAGGGQAEVLTVPRRAVVGIAPGAQRQVRTAIERRNGRVVSLMEDGNAFIVETPGPPSAFLDSLEDVAGVLYAEPDFIVTASDVTPNDSKWSSQWGFRKIQAPLAWETTKGSKTIVVGVIDSGVDYNHEDLSGRMWTNPGEIPGNGKDDDGNGWVDDVHGADCRNDDGDPMDDNDHGTHVAGTIGASTNNATGVAGVDWNVKIMALKFIGSDGSGKTSDAVQCIDYAIKMGAHLTNNSWGGAGYSQALYDAIARAKNAGDLFVAAAGNETVNLDLTPSYPASYEIDNVISVAASDSTDALGVFSNFGTTSVDIAAPGVGITSTTRNNGYATWNGTSMAAPHVAGVAALVLSKNSALSPSALKKTLIDNADEPALLVGKVAGGRRLNAARAVQAGSPSPTPVPSPSPSPTPTPSPTPKSAATTPPPPTPTPAPAPSRQPEQQPQPEPEPEPRPEPEPEPEPEQPSERSYASDAATVTTGANRGNPVSNLESNDGRSYRIESQKTKKGHIVDWFASTVVDPAASELSVDYDGSYSRKATQHLFLFDFSANRWEKMATADVGSSDRAFTIRPQAVRSYVSSQGHVRMRIRAAAARSFTARSDMIRFTIKA
jgi:subtilisin family serine protease/uncharacterized membrane protein YphA (DoxX/SURF4 family)